MSPEHEPPRPNYDELRKAHQEAQQRGADQNERRAEQQPQQEREPQPAKAAQPERGNLADDLEAKEQRTRRNWKPSLKRGR